MGQIDGFLARGQLWLVGLALFLVMLLSAQGGAALRKRLARPTGDAEAAEGYLLSATLALLGLLIAFTFSLAISRPRPWRSRARNSRSTKGRLGHARPDHCQGTACTRQFHGDRRQ